MGVFSMSKESVRAGGDLAGQGSSAGGQWMWYCAWLLASHVHMLRPCAVSMLEKL